MKKSVAAVLTAGVMAIGVISSGGGRGENLYRNL